MCWWWRGENRLTGQSRDASILALAQVGHPDYEVPLGPTIPAYYGLVASRYMHEYGLTQEDLAEFAVLMRRHALMHPGAQFHDAITVADVMASKPVALPLKLLDCCPVSDGGAAFVVSREPTTEIGVRVRGCAQAHTHQHVTAAPALSELGAEIAIARAKAASGVAISDVRYAAFYDSFTITLAMLLEDLGLAGRGEAAAQVRAGYFDRDGAMPLNTHGGLTELRPLRRRRRDGASGRNPSADDGARGQPPGARRLGRFAARRWRRIVLACQHVSGAHAMSGEQPGFGGLDHGRGSDQSINPVRPAAGGNISAAASAPDVAQPTRNRNTPAARGRSMPPRWCAARPRRKPARMFPTTSFWSMPPRAFA
jgi:hypothetical protein